MADRIFDGDLGEDGSVGEFDGESVGYGTLFGVVIITRVLRALFAVNA